MSDLEDKVLLLLGDGKPRTELQIYDEIYGEGYSRGRMSNMRSKVRHLYKCGYLTRKHMGQAWVYAISGVDLDQYYNIDELVGASVDWTKERKECIYDLLVYGGGEYTVAQLARAYYVHLNDDRYTEDVMYGLVAESCKKLYDWGRVEKVEIFHNYNAWKAIA